MEEALKYVQNQMVQAPFRLKFYAENEKGDKYPQRNVYGKIDEYLRNFLDGSNLQNRWIIVPGLRGVGKTTVLAQLFLNHFREVGERRMLYISLDEAVNVLDSSLREILAAYEKINGESFERLSKPLFIFIDEVQYDPKWASVLKSLYDRSNKVFIVCSGSSAVSLQANPDVVRRAIFQKMFPASFSEFLMIRDGKYPTRGLKKNIRNGLFVAESAGEAYKNLKNLESSVIGEWSNIDRHYVDEYLKIGTLPFAISIQDEARVYQTISLLLDKVINQDIQSLGRFDVPTLNNIKRILFLLAEADTVSVQKLSSELGMSVNTISNVLEVMELAEMLIRVMPHGSNSKKVRKPSRYQFTSSAMRSAFLSVAGNEQIFAAQRGRLMEDIVALTLYRTFVAQGHGALTYDSSKGGADFILTIAEKSIVPIEVGMGTKLGTQVRSTMKKIGATKYGVVICNNSLELLEDANVVKVPLDYFLLM